MNVSGFTFLRNAVINGFPFEESIQSLLPLVDEYIVVIGLSDDNTRDRVLAINSPKIRVIDTVWNDHMRDRGFVYGQQKMIGQYACSGRWAFYLEADEVLNEREVPQISKALEEYAHDDRVESLYFDFFHFYGTARQHGIAGYRKAPRIIKTSVRSIAPDGLFWVVLDENKRGRYPRAKYAGGSIYHYGHCRSITTMNEKLKLVGQYWGANHSEFKGYGSIDTAELRLFQGEHPKIMSHWIESHSEKTFAQDTAFRPSVRDYRNRLRFAVEEKFGVELSKKHYKEIRD